MRSTALLFILLALSILAVAVLTALGAPIWAIFATTGLAAVILALLWRSVVKPKGVVMRGMELIAAQDFNNRLARVGEHDADALVDLFNSLIDKLRNERLYNLEQENFMRQIVDASPMGMVMTDFDGRVRSVNKAFMRLAGLNGDIVGQPLASLDFGLRDALLSVPLGQSVTLRRDGAMVLRLWHLSFIQRGFKREFYLVESLTEEMMKAEKAAYGKVIRMISHEVNNTMGGVRSILETLAEIHEADRDVAEVIDSCSRRCTGMCDFISAYADVVKVPRPVKKGIDLNEELRRLLPFLRGIVGEHIKLTHSVYAKPMKLEIDPMLMEQAVVNIVKNAAESIGQRPDGRIAITTSTDAGRPVLEIANNGEPITPEVASQLFSPFFSTKKDGRGLGLTLISEILDRHSASYSLRTDASGLTRFIIRF